MPLEVNTFLLDLLEKLMTIISLPCLILSPHNTLIFTEVLYYCITDFIIFTLKQSYLSFTKRKKGLLFYMFVMDTPRHTHLTPRWWSLMRPCVCVSRCSLCSAGITAMCAYNNSFLSLNFGLLALWAQWLVKCSIHSKQMECCCYFSAMDELIEEFKCSI